MYYEIEKNGLKNVSMEDGSIVTMREYVVRIPAADDGTPTESKVNEDISKAYPAHGPVSVEIRQGETVGLPAELFRDLAVKVIRPASQR